MCSCLDPMAQDIPIPEQDIVVEEQELPQTNPEPEMGAAAAAEYDTSPSLLRNPPPIPAGTARPSALDMILQAMEANTRRMENKMKEDTNGMREEMKEMRGEMQNMGAGLQKGLE